MIPSHCVPWEIWLKKIFAIKNNQPTKKTPMHFSKIWLFRFFVVVVMTVKLCDSVFYICLTILLGCEALCERCILFWLIHRSKNHDLFPTNSVSLFSYSRAYMETSLSFWSKLFRLKISGQLCNVTWCSRITKFALLHLIWTADLQPCDMHSSM